MPSLKRRQFLQWAGSVAASVGVSQVNWVHQGDRYAQVLAQPTPRKLALLVGINQYSRDHAGWGPLRGCLTDVRMQEELLVHRFGFNRQDIVKVVDGEATRSGIITAFNEHLIQQARPGDVVVFHYSGHGSRVLDPTPCPGMQLNSTFVPIDSPLPDVAADQNAVVNDIMGHTLFLLMSALPTDHVTVVLDSCHSGGGKRGAIALRARDGAGDGYALVPSDAELELQNQLRFDLGLSPEEVSQRRCDTVAKGVVIASASADQYAADASFEGVYAGAFTYLMTQYLWQQAGNDAFGRTFVDIDRATQSIASNRIRTQNPEFEANVSSDQDNAPIYFTAKQTIPAEAVITQMEGEQVTFWMGGIHPKSLPAFQQDAVFEALSSSGEKVGLVKVVAPPDQLEGRGEWIERSQGTLPTPILLQERIRGIPQDLVLKVGLDPSLGDDRAGAELDLTAIARIQPAAIEDGVDYILGRLTPELRSLQSDRSDALPADGSIGLFLPDLSGVPNSFGAPGESVTEAIRRLVGKLKLLLATRLLHSIANPGSSRVNIAASLTIVGNEATTDATPVALRGTRGTSQDEPPASRPSPRDRDTSRLPLGAEIQLAVTNHETRYSSGLYISLMAIDPDGAVTLLFPNDWLAPDSAALIQPHETLRVPDADRGDRFRIRIGHPLGVTEILIIASTVPLRSTLASLSDIAAGQSTRSSAVDLGDRLRSDLGGTRGVDLVGEDDDIPANARTGVSSQQLAALSFTFEVYDPALLD